MIMLRMVMIGIMEILNFELCQPLNEQHCGAILWDKAIYILIDGKIFSAYRQWLWWWGWCDDRNDEEDGDNRDSLSTSEWTLWSHLVIQGKCRAGFRSTSCVFLSMNGWFSSDFISVGFGTSFLSRGKVHSWQPETTGPNVLSLESCKIIFHFTQTNHKTKLQDQLHHKNQNNSRLEFWIWNQLELEYLDIVDIFSPASK